MALMDILGFALMLIRHIFYQHRELFGNQRQVDDLVDRLALTLGTTREALNIVCDFCNAWCFASDESRLRHQRASSQAELSWNLWMGPGLMHQLRSS